MVPPPRPTSRARAPLATSPRSTSRPRRSARSTATPPASKLRWRRSPARRPTSKPLQGRKRRREARSEAPEPAGLDQRRPREGQQPLGEPHRGRGADPAHQPNAAQAGQWKVLTFETPENERRVGDQQIAWLETLKAKGLVDSGFNTGFFTSGDSREAEQAGILGALVGSLMTMFVTLVFCLPVGVGRGDLSRGVRAKNRWTDIIEININNLAAVPSIVYGLLGLAIFLNFFGMPRSSAVVGGFVLALLVLPTIIIASRAALKAVPPSIREAALGVGASHQQAVFHHTLPLAMPGIMTGTIIGMAHALGETAPLLLIGMVAFIVDVPTSFTSATTALPVQIYLWSDLPEVAFQAKTSAAILVLLLFLFAMNGLAILLRKRFERRW
ncbi:ABC transporter permease subunit [Chenggangzhangella methanolivorans]|uniref:ABC transporter permease subunit n=1 Tax=Chenggangzhangella methanolivorans TaxID=1437009 RepID=A0A9E6RJZ1_9HYPH|nr:ABC transporter permease subunit [Chenggangzhangella methanolivorans]